MVAARLLPFDAHNHIQLGPPPPIPFLSSPPPEVPHHEHTTLPENPTEIDRHEEEKGARCDVRIDDVSKEEFLVRSLSEYIRHELRGKHLSGMALMATHPRDFATLLGLERELQQADGAIEKTEDDEEATTMKLVSCLGVHPWFLHELDSEGDWEAVPSPHCASSSSSTPPAPDGAAPETVPRWIANLEAILASHPHLSVGEIGLDNFHFDPVTKEPTSPMDKQVEAFKLQLEVAVRWHRPVSLHCVRAMGKLVDTLNEVAEENFRRLSIVWNESETGTGGDDVSGQSSRERHILPPKIYFHAFGGKAPTATQLIKTLEKPRRIKIRGATSKSKKFVSVTPPKIYFGFAPPVNFRSPKTASVIRAVGLDRLVLETDREDVRMIGADMEAGTAWISEVLGITKDELVSVTNDNARDLYGC